MFFCQQHNLQVDPHFLCKYNPIVAVLAVALLLLLSGCGSAQGRQAAARMPQLPPAAPTISAQDYLIYKKMVKLYPEHQDRKRILWEMSRHHFVRHDHQQAIEYAQKYINEGGRAELEEVLEIMLQSYLALEECQLAGTVLEWLPTLTAEDGALVFSDQYQAEGWVRVGECWRNSGDNVAATESYKRAQSLTKIPHLQAQIKRTLARLVPVKLLPVVESVVLAAPVLPVLLADKSIGRLLREGRSKPDPLLAFELLRRWQQSDTRARESLDVTIKQQLQGLPHLIKSVRGEFPDTPYYAYMLYVAAIAADKHGDIRMAQARYQKALAAGMGYFPAERALAARRIEELDYQPGDSMKIGVVIALSGEYATIGERFIAGCRAALDSYQRTNSVVPKLIIRDSGGDPKKAAQLALELIEQDQVMLLLGGTFSVNAHSIAKVAIKHRTMYLSPLATDPRLNGLSTYVLSTSYKESDMAGTLAKYLINIQGYGRIAILHPEARALGSENEFVAAFRQVATRVGHRDPQSIINEPFKQNETDFQAQLKRIREFLPEALCVIGNPYQLSLILPQIDFLEIETPLYGGNGFYAPGIIKMDPKYTRGVTFTVGYNPYDQRMANRDFVGLYYKANKDYPDLIAALAFDTLGLVLGNWSVDVDRKTIRALIYQRSNYLALTGLILLQPNGVVDRESVMLMLDQHKLIRLTN